LDSDIKGRTEFVFKKWGMRRITEPKRVEIKGDWGNCVMKSFEVFIH
jgi:hypothetical protein